MLSIVPPAEARVGRGAARGRAAVRRPERGRRRETARDLAARSTARSPARRRSAAGTTRIYLSGPRAGEVAALPFDGVDVVVVGDEVGAASAVKMSTASVYKGSAALLTQALRAADHYGVLEHVLDDLGELADDAGRRIARAAAKSERYVGEMHEIAAAQAAAGLDPALFEAMAEVYAEIAGTELAQVAPEDARLGSRRGAGSRYDERELPERLEVREPDADEA